MIHESLDSSYKVMFAVCLFVCSLACSLPLGSSFTCGGWVLGQVMSEGAAYGAVPCGLCVCVCVCVCVCRKCSQCK